MFTFNLNPGYVLSCQNKNLEATYPEYIYRKIQEKSKGQTLLNGFALIENCRYAIRAKMSDISQVFEGDDIFTSMDAIAGLKSSHQAGFPLRSNWHRSAQPRPGGISVALQPAQPLPTYFLDF